MNQLLLLGLAEVPAGVELVDGETGFMDEKLLAELLDGTTGGAPTCCISPRNSPPRSI